MVKSNLKCNRPPEGCRFSQGRWTFRTQINNQRKEIALRVGNKLLREDCPCSTLHEAVEVLKQAPSNTLEKLVISYMRSDRFKALAESTKKGYRHYWKNIGETKLKGGKFFKNVPFAQITPGTIRKYLDKRVADGVPIGGNREVEFLSAVFGWAFERDKVKSNPCKGVRHNAEKARERLISQGEYSALLKQVSGTVWYSACEIAYLCRARRGEVFNLKLSDISDDGVFIARTKGSWDEITLWTPRLKKAIDLLIDNRKRVIANVSESRRPIPMHEFLFIKPNGEPYNRKNALDSAWQRIVDKLIENGTMPSNDKFTFHDIKACGVTNHPLNESGHKTEKAKQRYLRGTKRVNATE